VKTFLIVVLPIIRPGLAALGVWVFITTWNDFKLPLIVLSSADKLTVPLALMNLNSLYVADTPAVMLGTAISLIPVFMVFFLLSKQFISGLTAGAVKS
jgi:ABC-type glycerol-3-phosphate transport system permease component